MQKDNRSVLNWKTVLTIALLTVVYIGVGRLSLLLGSTPANVTPVWPPAGIALAAFLLLGNRIWAGIFLGSFFLHISFHGITLLNLLAGMAIGVGNTLAPWLATVLLRRLSHHRNLLEQSHDVFRLIVVGAIAAPLISATIGITSLCLSDRAPWNDYGNLWWTWWTSNMVGVLIFTPLLLAWSKLPRTLYRPSIRQLVELTLLLILLFAISLVAFWRAYPLEYMLILVLIWSALRFGQHGATLLVVLISIISILGTVKGYGSFFRRDSLNESLLLLQSFVGAVAVAVLVLSAMIVEREQADRRLKRVNAELERMNEQLEQRVEERTAQLKESEAALQTSAAELRALFAAMTELIVVFDAEGRYLKIAPTNPSLLYRPPEELIGKTLAETIPEHAEMLTGYIRQALGDQKTINTEYRLRIRDQFVWFAASISPITQDSAIWVARDVTERKRAEEALSLSEEKFAKAFRSSANLIAIATLADGRFIEVNDTFLKIGGFQVEEVIGHTSLELNLWANVQERDQVMQLLRAEGAFRNREGSFRMKSGEIRVGLLSAEIIDLGGTPCVLYVFNDITERKRAEEALQVEQEKSERLLLNILPKMIADQLKQDQGAIAEQFEEATILFADIVDFTPLSASMVPTELVILLNQIFSKFDQLAERYGLEKIKTIGDAYMVVGGLPEPRTDHAEAVAEMAIEMQSAIAQFSTRDGHPFNLRIGINTGPVVAGVIGMKKFIYDLWGDTVNVASRMESQGTARGIQVTTATYEHLKNKYYLESRGAIAVKGKGEMETYWLLGRQ